jgi:YD repeat-containing protein
VTYQYDAAHHMTSKTNNLGQTLLYSYDQYGRLTSKQYPADPRQNATYYYDTNPLDSSGYSQNIWGRLAAVSFASEINGQSLAYMYSYSQAGRVAGKRLQVGPAQSGQTPANIDTYYVWDNQGRMIDILLSAGWPAGRPHGGYVCLFL